MPSPDKQRIFQPGAVLRMRPDQAGPRMHSLSYIKGDRYRVTAQLEFPETEVPEVVDASAEAGAVADLHPDEAASDAPPGVDQLDAAASDEAIVAVLNDLDPADDAHWTKDGKADLNVVSEYMGRRITRSEVDAAAPGFNRQTLKI